MKTNINDINNIRNFLNFGTTPKEKFVLPHTVYGYNTNEQSGRILIVACSGYDLTVEEDSVKHIVNVKLKFIDDEVMFGQLNNDDTFNIAPIEANISTRDLAIAFKLVKEEEVFEVREEKGLLIITTKFIVSETVVKKWM